MRPEHMAVVIRLWFCVMSIGTPVQLGDCTELINIFVDKGTF
jgi:hypothetical protein